MAQSTAKMEYVLVVGSINQTISLCKLFSDLRFEQKSPKKIFYNDKSAIAIASNPVLHDGLSALRSSTYFKRSQDRRSY